MRGPIFASSLKRNPNAPKAQMIEPVTAMINPTACSAGTVVINSTVVKASAITAARRPRDLHRLCPDIFYVTDALGLRRLELVQPLTELDIGPHELILIDAEREVRCVSIFEFDGDCDRLSRLVVLAQEEMCACPCDPVPRVGSCSRERHRFG